MANTTITNLPAATAITGAEQIPAVQSGTTVRITAQQVASLYQQLAVFTVSTLPTATAGLRAYVTDSTLAASGNFGASVTGGGTNKVPVWSNGSGWYIG